MFKQDLSYLIERPGNIFTSSIVILLACTISIYGSKAGCETTQQTGPAPRPFAAAIHNVRGPRPVPTATDLRRLALMIIGLARAGGGEVIPLLFNSISARSPHLLWKLLNMSFFVAQHIKRRRTISGISVGRLPSKATNKKHTAPSLSATFRLQLSTKRLYMHHFYVLEPFELNICFSFIFCAIV